MLLMAIDDDFLGMFRRFNWKFKDGSCGRKEGEMLINHVVFIFFFVLIPTKSRACRVEPHSP